MFRARPARPGLRAMLVAAVALSAVSSLQEPAHAGSTVTSGYTPLVFVVGDSYTYRAEGYGLRSDIKAAGGRIIIAASPGGSFDYAGRGTQTGFQAIASHRRAIHLADIVIIEEGTNGDVTGKKLDRAFRMVHSYNHSASIYAVNYGATRLGSDDQKRAVMRKYNAENQILRRTILAERRHGIAVRGLNWCGQVFGGTFWTCTNQLVREKASKLSPTDGLHPAPAPQGTGMTDYKNLLVSTVRRYYAAHR